MVVKEKRTVKFHDKEHTVEQNIKLSKEWNRFVTIIEECRHIRNFIMKSSLWKKNSLARQGQCQKNTYETLLKTQIWEHNFVEKDKDRTREI